MTEEEKNNAAAYIKLQDDVRQLIIDTVFAEMQNYSGLLQSHIKTNIIYAPEFEQKVKDVIKNQMMKY